MDITVSVNHRKKRKESEKLENIFREREILKHESGDSTNYYWCASNSPQEEVRRI